MTLGLGERLRASALEAGFVAAGWIDFDDPHFLREYPCHVSRYESWISAGFQAAMQYLVRGRARRSDPQLVFPKAQSAFCVLKRYDSRPYGDGLHTPRYARYLRGPDYHDSIVETLESILAPFRDELRWKVCVDTSAVLERSLAHLSGLGFIGKNTLLIHPTHGSYTLIGVVLVDRKLGINPESRPDRFRLCGSCTACFKACPTEALSEAGGLESQKCIAYWTLEHRGPGHGESGVHVSAGDARGWVAGCDLCQEACPFNFKVARRDAQSSQPHGASSSEGLPSWAEHRTESDDQFRKRTLGSALSRVKPKMRLRNLLWASRSGSAHSGGIET